MLEAHVAESSQSVSNPAQAAVGAGGPLHKHRLGARSPREALPPGGKPPVAPLILRRRGCTAAVTVRGPLEALDDGEQGCILLGAHATLSEGKQRLLDE